MLMSSCRTLILEWVWVWVIIRCLPSAVVLKPSCMSFHRTSWSRQRWQSHYHSPSSILAEAGLAGRPTTNVHPVSSPASRLPRHDLSTVCPDMASRHEVGARDGMAVGWLNTVDRDYSLQVQKILIQSRKISSEECICLSGKGSQHGQPKMV